MASLRAPHVLLGRAALACTVSLGLTLVAGGAADAAARKGTNPCQPAGTKTVTASGSARLYTKRGPKRPASADPSTLTRLYGCRSGKRPVKMATAGVYSAGTLSFRLEQLAGRFASVVTSSSDRGGNSD